MKAVWADVPMSDAYRDVTFHGGAVDAGFIPLWLGLTTSLSSLPAVHHARRPGRLGAHLGRPPRERVDFAGQKMLSSTLGQDSAYDGPFYRLRSPGDRAAQIEVPVVIQGGWWDIFQRGEPLLYEQLTASPNKKLFMSPHYHTDSGPALEDPDLKNKWFDHWLQGADNGVENTPSVNLYPIGGDHWEHHSELAASRRDLHARLPGRREIAQLFRSSRGRRRQGAAPASIKPVLTYDNAVDGGRRPGPVRDRQPHLGGLVAHLHERAARGGHRVHRPAGGERVGGAHVEGRHARERALATSRRPESRIR